MQFLDVASIIAHELTANHNVRILLIGQNEMYRVIWGWVQKECSKSGPGSFTIKSASANPEPTLMSLDTNVTYMGMRSDVIICPVKFDEMQLVVTRARPECRFYHRISDLDGIKRLSEEDAEKAIVKAAKGPVLATGIYAGSHCLSARCVSFSLVVKLATD